MLGIAGVCVAIATVATPSAGAQTVTHPSRNVTVVGKMSISPKQAAKNRALLKKVVAQMPTKFRKSDRIARAMSAAADPVSIGNPIPPLSSPPKDTSVVEYNLPPGTIPIDEKNGPDGNVWFTAIHSMIRLDPVTKKITIFPTPAKIGIPYAVNGGPGPWVYFTSLGVSAGAGQPVFGNAVNRINIYTHQFQTFPIPTPVAYPADIKTGADGNQWFTEAVAGKVGMFNPNTKKIQEFDTGPLTLPQDVATGEGSCLVFRKCTRDYKEGINYAHWPLAGEQVWYTLMGPLSLVGSRLTSLGGAGLPGLPPLPPLGDVSGLLGGLNLPEPGNALFTVDPKTFVTHRYPYPTAAAGTLDVEPGPSDNRKLWFSEIVGNKMGYIDVVTKKFHEFNLPTPGSIPFTVGPTAVGVKDEKVYSAEWRTNAIAVLSGVDSEHPTINELPLPTGPLAIPVDFVQSPRSESTYTAELLGNKLVEIRNPDSFPVGYDPGDHLPPGVGSQLDSPDSYPPVRPGQ